MIKNRYKCNNGITLAGMLITAAIITLLAVIAIPQFLSSRMRANESSARAALKTISTALEAYAEEGKQGYPTDISLLITAEPPYLNRNYIANSLVQGYNFACEFLDINGYSCSAKPEICGQTGSGIYTITTGGVFTERDCK
jgi:type II secretory pathway pseudopilin PulG